MTDTDFTAIFNQVHGFLSLAEAELLYRLASEVPANGVIVEIGSYRGRSTIALALGAKVNGAQVFAVDPHEEYESGDTHYSMADNQYYYANLAKFGVGDIVRTINLSSMAALNWWRFGNPVNLLWIDGSHGYNDIHFDLKWAEKVSVVNGKIVMHDTAGYHPGVTQALNEIIATGQWRIDEQVDAAAVLVRVK